MARRRRRRALKPRVDGRESVPAGALRLPGPAGMLEGLLEEPAGGPPLAAAVVGHPHPLHGGSLRNTIVVRTARALRSAGLATLRINFRGVGASEGTHDGNGAEEGDVAAGLDHLAGRFPGIPLWAAGYSFGARAACGLAEEDERVRRLVLVALPIRLYGAAYLEALRQPGLLLFGASDEFGTKTDLARLVPALPERIAVEEIPGADHFFRGKTPLVEESVRVYAKAAVTRKE